MRKKYSIVHTSLRKWFYQKIIDNFLFDCQNVLDAGCGLGDFIRAAQSKGKTVLGIDSDREVVRYCQRQGLPVEFCDVNDLKKIKSYSFDAIFCSHVIEHLEDPRKMLREFRRVLRKGGKLVIITPTPYGDFWHEPTHKVPYSRQLLKKTLAANRFKVSKISFDKTYMFGVNDSETLSRIINLLPLRWAKANIVVFAKKE